MKFPTVVWIWVPVIGISLTVFAHAALIITAKQVRPTRVEDQPYQASARIDAEKERRAAFIRAGLHLEASGQNGRLHLALTAPAGMTISGPATVNLWRPDDPDLDATYGWDAPSIPTNIPLPRSGRWRIRVELPPATGWPDGARVEALVDAR